MAEPLSEQARNEARRQLERIIHAVEHAQPMTAFIKIRVAAGAALDALADKASG